MINKNSGNNLKTKSQAVVRLTIPDAASTIQVHPDHTQLFMRNDGGNAMKFNFEDDDASDTYTLPPGKETPVFSVSPGEIINTDGLGGSTTVELVSWG